MHNVRNALAAIAVGAFVGIAPADLAEGLRSSGASSGGSRRSACARGVTVLDDFAHHPTAVHETLAALRTGYPDRRIWAVFEPRSASSCRRVFQDDFAAAFGGADEVVVAGVFRSSFRSRSGCRPSSSSTICAARGQRARHIPDVDEIVAHDRRRSTARATWSC